MQSKLFLILFLIEILSGCVTSRTKYQPHGRSGGYSEQKINDKIMVARFSGNGYTDSNVARFFSEFRAVEICYEAGYKFPRVYDTEDKSTSQTVQKTSNFSYQTPTHFSGTTNSNTNIIGMGGWGQAYTNTKVDGTVYGGNQYGNSTTWNEIFHYPIFDTYFSCSNQAYMMKLRFRPISPDDMKPYVKDLMGAIQVEDFTDDSPNREILHVGDLIVKVNGVRIQNIPQFANAIDGSKNKSQVNMDIVREGEAISISAIAIDITHIREEEMKKLIKNACSISEIKNRSICNSRTKTPLEKTPTNHISSEPVQKNRRCIYCTQ